MTKRNLPLITTLVIALLLSSACAKNQPSFQNADTRDVVSRQLVKSTHSWDGQPLPAYPQGQAEITILRISIPPKAKLVTHKHTVINAGVLISGELIVNTIEGKTLYLKAGDPIIEVVNTLHHGINPGDTPADIIVFYAGSEGMQVTVVEP